jgi:drug/metabolite transporter (DMT)-like permease
MGKQQKAYMLALAAVLFWSTAGSAFKLSLSVLPAELLLLHASLVSLLFLLAWKLIGGGFASCFRISGRQWLNSAIMGLLNPFAYYLVLFKAYDLLLAQEAVALNYVWPVTLVLLSIPVLKQKISLLSILALFISFAGMLVIIMKGSVSNISFSDPLGIALALVSSVFWATFWLMNMRDKREDTSKMLLNFIFGFSYILIYVALRGGTYIISYPGMAGSLYIGLFEMGLTFVLWLKALQLSSSTAKVSNLVYISPFLSLIFVSFFVGESIHGYTIAGLLLIVAGIVIQRAVR